MKRTIYSILFAVLALMSAGCQKIEEQSINLAASGGLTITGSIAGYDGTRISYSFNGDATSGLKTSWEEGDRIFGFDNNGDTFTFIVSDIKSGVAQFVGDYVPSKGATRLYAIYYPGKGIEDIDLDGQSLSVDISSQNGTLGSNTPAIMCATSSIGTDGSVNFNFTNQTAIVGIYKMTLKNGETPVAASEKITGVTLHGVKTTGTIEIDNETFGLVPEAPAGDITAPVDLTTKEGGIISVDPKNPSPYFAVIPTSQGQIGITAFNDNNLYNASSIAQVDIEAGHYYYIGKTIKKAVARIGNTGYNSLSDAIDAVGDDETTITLMRDVTLENYLSIPEYKKIILNLAGNTINGNVDGPINSGLIMISGDLTIEDSKTSGEINNTFACLQVNSRGFLTLKGGKIKGTANTSDDQYPTIFVKGEAVFTGGEISQEGSTDRGALLIDGGNVTFPRGSTTKVTSSKNRTVYIRNTSNLTVYDGTFESTSSNSGRYPLAIRNCNGAVKIYGGTFTGYNFSYGYISESETEQNKVEIYGGEINLQNNFCGSGYGTINFSVSGGYLTKLINSSYISTGYDCSKLTEAYKEIYGYQVVAGYDALFDDTTPCTIAEAVTNANDAESPCTIKLLRNASATSGLTINNTNGAKVTLDLNGKTLNGKITAQTDFEINDSSNTPGKNDGTGTICYTGATDTYAVRVNKSAEFTLSGGTLIASDRPLRVVGESSNRAKATIVNGTLEATGTAGNEAATYLTHCDVIFGNENSGTINVKAPRPFYASSGFNLTINKGLYSTTGSASNSSMFFLYPSNNGNLTINGGTFNCMSAPQFFTYNDGNVNPTVNITGGDFSWRLTFAKPQHTNLLITGGKFISDIALNSPIGIKDNFICDGPNSEDEPYKYTVTNGFVKVGNKYYSSVSTANDAIASAESDVTVKFVKSLTLEDQLEISNNRAKITLDLNGKTIKAQKDKDKSAVLVNGASTVVDFVDNVGGGRLDHTYSGTAYTLTVNSGTANIINANISNTTSSGYGRVAVRVLASNSNAYLNVFGGKIIGGRAIRLGGNREARANVSISGGLVEGLSETITENESKVYYSTISFESGYSNLVVNGGTITGKARAVIYCTVAASENSTISITKNRKTGAVPFIYSNREELGEEIYSVASSSKEAGSTLFNGCDWNFYTNNLSVMNVGTAPKSTCVEIKDRYGYNYNYHIKAQ